MIHKAIAVGRALQSSQSGLIHYHHHRQDNEPHRSIPIYENFLFALALLRSRVAENIHEAKNILSRLLHFHVNGNFPIYLHEYPVCYDRLLAADILPVFHWIMRDFIKILGEPLRINFQEAQEKAFKHCIQQHNTRPAPYHRAMKINDVHKSIRKEWFNPNIIGDLLATQEMHSKEWPELMTYVANTHHPNNGCYIGPGNIHHDRFAPQLTAYDLFFGKELNDTPLLLQGALIHRQLPLVLHHMENVEGEGWITCHRGEYAFCIQSEGKEFFKVVWGTKEQPHTLALCGNITTVDWEINKSGCKLILKLGDRVDEEDRKKSKEVNVFCDIHDDLQIGVDGIHATTFSLGNTISIKDSFLQLKCCFQLIEGDGHFMGHLMKGNRPLQVSAKGDLRFDAYDWHLSLRTVSRTQQVSISVTFSFEGQ